MSIDDHLKELQRLAHFGPDDAARLAELRAVAVPDFPRIAQAYCDRVLVQQGSDFADKSAVVLLRDSMQSSLTQVLGAQFGRAHYALTTAFGADHHRAGLPQHYLIPAMSIVRIELERIAETRLKAASKAPAIASLHKSIELELSLMLEGYRDAFERARCEKEIVVRNELSESLERSEQKYMTLAAGLAHEIRNPLNGAQLHAAFLSRALAKSDAPADLREAALVVTTEIKRLATLVTEFLDFALPKPLARTDVSILALCDRAVLHARAAAKDAGVELIRDIGTDVVLSADPAKVEKIVLNLLENAIEAAPRGGHVVVRVSQENAHAAIEIEDDGPGFSVLNAPMFDAFYSTKSQRTGLGLSVAHRLVTDHGGTIRATRDVGRTVFRVTLPLGNVNGEMWGHDGAK